MSPTDERAGARDAAEPPGPTPPRDFWEVLYGRRSIRRFRPDPVPRELVEQVLHAGIWAPSSCNYQMWDIIAVDDPELNRRLAALSSQMGNAPVNVVVAYSRDFSREGLANVQSASALIQNMSLAAHALGLGSFWITQMGDAERVRELVGLPRDRMVVAVLALGWPQVVPKRGPKRRPLAQVAHWNCYAGRPIPSSTRPEDWESDLLAIYQRARVLNGLRHNKPRPWEVAALEQALERLLPQGRESAGEGARKPRWLDVLPTTGIVTERLSRLRRGFCFDIVERTPEVAAFCAVRTTPRAGVHAWPVPADGFPPPPEEAYDIVSCLYRFEGLTPGDRERLMADAARWLAPGGHLLVGFVHRGSFHTWTERLRARRGGPGGVEYVLAPDPNIGPFEPLLPREIETLARAAGLARVGALGLQAAPPREEVEFRTRNFGRSGRNLARLAGALLRSLARLPGVENSRGRFQYRLFQKPLRIA